MGGGEREEEQEQNNVEKEPLMRKYYSCGTCSDYL